MNKVLTKIKNETGFSNYSMRVICTGIAITTFLTWIAAVGSTGISDVPLEKIDMKLYEQSKADIRAWLDARIKESGDFGVYSFGWSCLQIKGDIANVDLKRGGIATAGGGKHPTHVARMEDGYQFRPFCLLLYAHQLTGEKKYLDSALKHGELISLRMIHPDWGWCPDHFDAKGARPYSQRKTGHDTKGVSGGRSYSDYATSNGFRTAVFMYHLTGDEKYLKRARNLGKWIFATQLGKGKVRGWGDNYGADNKPVPARNFEGWSIDPRNWNRFVGPLLTWLYAATGEEKYRRLFEESTEWMLSMEHLKAMPLNTLMRGKRPGHRATRRTVTISRRSTRLAYNIPG